MINNIRLRSFQSNTGEDGEVLARNAKSNQVEYAGEAGPNKRLTDKIAFNKKLGVLSFIRADGEVVQASGFLTEDQIGHGPKGKIGRTGKKGRDGEDGRDGRPGPAGCEGPVGPPGDKGMDGRDGEDGPIGVTGSTGCPGPKGPRGDQGDKGPKGFQGSMGKNGLSCIVGCPGPAGFQGVGDVVVQTQAPEEPHVYLWGVPFDGKLPDLPSGPDEMTATLNSIEVTMTKGRGTTYSAAGALIISDFKGGEGPFVIEWSGDYKSKVGISRDSLSMDSKTLTLEANTEVAPGTSTTISGNAAVIITDSATGKQLTLATTYKFVATNQTTPPVKILGSVSDGSAVEGNKIRFLVSLSSAVQSGARASYTLTNGTASSSDYDDPVQGYVDISAGTDQFYIEIDAVQDSISNEDTETFQIAVTIPGVEEQTAGSMTATGSIVESTTNVVPVSIGAVTVTEGNTAQVKVTLSGNYVASSDPNAYAVKYRTVVGTADANDYSVKSGTIKFTQSWQEIIVSIDTTDDSTRETTEKFNLELYDAGSSLDIGGATKSVQISIKDNDSTYNGGGGCIGWGSEAITPNGVVPVESLLIGDTILGYAEPSMPSHANSTYPDYLNWKALELNGKKTWVTVVNARHDIHHVYCVINDLSLTKDHPIMFMRDNIWQWAPSHRVQVGDIVLGTDGEEIPVTKAEVVYGELKVVELDVEPHDVYYVNGILVHNRDDNLLQEKV